MLLSRRHVAQSQPVGNVAEQFGLGEYRLGGAKAREIEIVIVGHLPVAIPAGPDEQRLDLCGIGLREVVCTIGRRGRECERGNEQHSASRPVPPCPYFYEASHQIRSLALDMLAQFGRHRSDINFCQFVHNELVAFDSGLPLLG